RRVAFLMFFATFVNARDLMGDVGSPELMVNGEFEEWQRSRVPLYVLANTIAGTLRPTDAAKLRAAFDSSHPVPLTPEQVAQLSAPAAAAYHILAGDQPDEVQRNLDAFSPPM